MATRIPMKVKDSVNFFVKFSNFEMKAVPVTLDTVFCFKSFIASLESFFCCRLYTPDVDLVTSPCIKRSITGLINANCAPMNSVKSPMQSRVRKTIFQCGFAYENNLPHSLIVLLRLDI